MPNLNKVFRDEIARLSRREVKKVVTPLRRQVVNMARAAREQRQQIQRLEKEVARKADQKRLTIEPETISEDDDVRVPAGSVKKHRERLGISQREMALLLDVSSLTISSWENDRSQPRGKNKLAFAELRKMGVREVRERLEKMEGAG